VHAAKRQVDVLVLAHQHGLASRVTSALPFTTTQC
jgi:hypothetical protein